MLRMAQRSIVVCLLHASALLVGSMVPALALGEPQANRLTVSAGPLGQTLFAITEAFGANILADERVVAGVRAAPIEGATNAREALTQALSGTGLSYQTTDDRFVVTELQPVREAAETPLVVEQILVYGTKQGLSVQETKESVTVLTATDLDEQAVFRLEDVLLRTPNVTVGEGIQNIAIRGIGAGGVGGAGTGLTLNTYIDGAPIGFFATGAAYNLWDVDQVEVLRGPQSTTQGRNALAGAVAIQTADPEYEFATALRVIAAENDIRNYSGMVTAPLIDDQVAFRMAMDYREEDWDRDHIRSGERSGIVDELTGRAKLLIEPDAIEDLRIELIAQYIEIDNVGGRTGFAFPVDPEERRRFDPFSGDDYSDFLSSLVIDSTRYAAEIQYGFSENWDLFVNVTREEIDRALGGFVINENEASLTQLDARFHFDYGRLRGWIGAYYYEEDADTTQILSISGPAFGGLIDVDGSVRRATNFSDLTENEALYGDVSLDVTDKLTLSVGARYDREDAVNRVVGATLELSEPCFAVLAPLPPAPCSFIAPLLSVEPGVVDTDFDAFLPRASVFYSFESGNSVAFQVSRGYRAGGAEVVGDSQQKFDPEYLINYEFAYRSTWLDERLTINANVFFADWEDQQIRVPTEVPTVARTANAGASELYGLELSTSYRVSDSLDVYVNMGWLETEFTDFAFAVDNQGQPLPLLDQQANLVTIDAARFANLAGNEFPSAPNLTANIGGSYTHSSGFFASANISYRDEIYTGINNFEENAVDSFVLVNGRIGWDWGEWRASVFGENLLDEEYLTSLSLIGVNVTGVSANLTNGLQRGGFGRPRIIGVQLEYSL